jgi:hypothetical protein
MSRKKGPVGRGPVSPLKVGGIFVHKSGCLPLERIPTPGVESPMPPTPVPPEKRADVERVARENGMAFSSASPFSSATVLVKLAT